MTRLGWHARLTVDAHARLPIAGSSGYTPLIYAAREGHVEIVQLLLESGAAPDAATAAGASTGGWRRHCLLGADVAPAVQCQIVDLAPCCVILHLHAPPTFLPQWVQMSCAGAIHRRAPSLHHFAPPLCSFASCCMDGPQ